MELVGYKEVISLWIFLEMICSWVSLVVIVMISVGFFEIYFLVYKYVVRLSYFGVEFIVRGKCYGLVIVVGVWGFGIFIYLSF